MAWLASILISPFIEIVQFQNEMYFDDTLLWLCKCGYVNIHIHIYIHRIEIWSRFLTHETTTVFHGIPMQMSIHITYSYSHFCRVSNSVRVAFLSAAPFVSVSKCSDSTHLPNTSNAKIFEHFIAILLHKRPQHHGSSEWKKSIRNRSQTENHLINIFQRCSLLWEESYLMIVCCWVHTEKCEWTIWRESCAHTHTRFSSNFAVFRCWFRANK